MINEIILLAGLATAAWTDGRSRRIPNGLLLVLFFARIPLLLCGFGSLSASLAGMATLGGLLFSLYLFFPGGIGAGDVKLFAVTGFYLGAEEALTVLFLAMTGALTFGLFARFRGGRKQGKGIAIAPFALASCVILLLLYGKIPFL
ncbi:MAG: prepilin peptidase [Lachnospiraceae bacterium]|nr:prepilin peptidase [Lachnospiraceae bacterium]